MSERVLWLRGVALQVWPHHARIESRLQLAPFPARSSGAGDGGGAVGACHDPGTVHDGNSGGHVTREHPRSLAGYTIVDPNGTTGTFASSNPGFANARSANPGFGNTSFANASFTNTRYANPEFTNPGFTNSWQGSYRHAWRSRRIARAYVRAY
jgi:hypothetical protein